MSVALTGAVKQRGPDEGPLNHTLGVICDEADDFGFACPSIESIAHGSRCSQRQAIRRIQLLEEQGWIKVKRKIFRGDTANAYFVDIEKLGVTISVKSKRSPMWSNFMRMMRALEARDKVSLLNGVLKFEKTPESVHIPETGDLFEEDLGSDMVSLENDAEERQNSTTLREISPIAAKTVEKGFEAVRKGDFAGDTMSRDTCHPRHVTSDTGGKPFNVLTHSLPITPKNAPQPPVPGGGFLNSLAASSLEPAAGSGQGKPPALQADWRSVNSAVAKVKRECNLSEPRLGMVIERAMRLEASKTDETPQWNAIAERMIAAHRAYAKLGIENLLRYPVGARKFFAQGLWRDQGLWAIDTERAGQRAGAGIGMQQHRP